MSQRRQFKRLLVSDIVVGAIASQARQFAEAGRRCIGEMRNGVMPGPVVPGIVCMSFSVELWLKALGCLSNPSGEVPTGHDLGSLFLGLSDEIQAALIARCGRPRDLFLQAIEADAKAFEVWRYSYEWAARHPPSTDGLEVMTVNLLLLNTLPDACDQVYEEFK
jgi:hypothetical protein